MSANGTTASQAAGESVRRNSSGGSSEGRTGSLTGVGEGRQRTYSQGSLSGLRVVVLAVDASPNAQVAFDWYLENVWKQDDYLVLVHCPEAPRLPTFSFKTGIAPPVHEWKTILDEMNAKTRKLEEDYEGTCISKKLRYKVRGEAMKHPGEGIIRVVEEEKADIVVMGTRGLGKIRRAVLGSVSDYVVRNANCPTIIVPGVKYKAMMERRASMDVM